MASTDHPIRIPSSSLLRLLDTWSEWQDTEGGSGIKDLFVALYVLQKGSDFCALKQMAREHPELEIRPRR